eukprot:g6283.t1
MHSRNGLFAWLVGSKYNNYVVRKYLTPRLPSTDKSCHKVLDGILKRRILSKNERDVLKGLQKEMCHTKILYVFFGTNAYGNKCVTEGLLQETIGGLWDGGLWRDGARHASTRLVMSVAAIKDSILKSPNYKPPERFEHLKKIVRELKQKPKLANSMRIKNKKKIQQHNDATDKIYDEMKKDLLEIKIKAADESYEWYMRWKRRTRNKYYKKLYEKYLGRIRKLQKCLKKGDDDVWYCAQREAKDRRDIPFYRQRVENYRKKSTKIQRFETKRNDIRKKVGKLSRRYRHLSDAEAFFKLLESYSCLPNTLRTYAIGRSNTIKPKKQEGKQGQRVVIRISRNLCLDLKSCIGPCRKEKKKFEDLNCEKVLQQTKGRLTKPRGRRLLSSDYDFDYPALWDEFASNVLTNGECDGRVLQDVEVDKDGSFEFECSKANALCACIVGVGETDWEAEFFSPEEEGSFLELTVFRDDETGYVSYELKENGEYLAYGDVNEGDVEGVTGYRRRRRLLQASRGGGS